MANTKQTKHRYPFTACMAFTFALFWVLLIAWSIYFSANYKIVESYNIEPTIIKSYDDGVAYKDGLTFQYTYNKKEYDGQTIYNYKSDGIPDKIPDLYIDTNNPENYLITTPKDFSIICIIIFVVSVVFVSFTYMIERNKDVSIEEYNDEGELYEDYS